MSNVRSIIRENIIKLLEEDTKFLEGDAVVDNEGNEGTISLSKHPYYAVRLYKTGITKSYDFNNLSKSDRPKDENEFYGKYDVEPEGELSESSQEELIHLNGILITKDGIKLTDILSDIRSIIGITIVRTEDIPNDTRKSKMFIKIDPFPFPDMEDGEIKSTIKSKIRQIPGTKQFFTQEDIKTPKQELPAEE